MNLAAQRAIKAALNGQWNEAIEFNLQALKESPDNIEALNRLARAHAALGQTNNAKRIWNKVLNLDRYNPIATVQLEKLKSYPSSKHKLKTVTPSNETFLEEPGKTKNTPLVRLAANSVISHLEPAQQVHLKTKKRLIAVIDNNQQYLGSLPDDLSAHLLKLLKAGNKYETLIRRVKKNSVHVFIKEKSRAKRYRNTLSFPIHKTTNILKLNQTTSIQEDPIDVAPTGEEEDYR